MKLAVSTWSYWRLIEKGLHTQYSVIQLAASTGFEGIEFTTLRPPEGISDIEYAALIREEAKRCNIEIIAYAVGGNLMETDIEAQYKEACHQVDVAAALGCPIMRHDTGNAWPNGAPESPDWRDYIPQMAELCRRISDYAATKGIKTCCENHGRIWQQPERILTLINEVNHPNFGWLIDCGNFTGADVVPLGAVSALKNHACHVHAKDLIFRKEPVAGIAPSAAGYYKKSVPVGEGDVKVDECLKLIFEAGYNGYVTVEYESDYPVIEGITKSAKFIRNI